MQDAKPGDEAIDNEVKYTGAVNDRPVLHSDGSAGGLYYLSARHYDPNSGRFLQQDTYKGDAMSPWTQNLYAYTSNNPVNYVDPTGHWSVAQMQKEAERRAQLDPHMTVAENLSWLRSQNTGEPGNPGTGSVKRQSLPVVQKGAAQKASTSNNTRMVHDEVRDFMAVVLQATDMEYFVVGAEQEYLGMGLWTLLQEKMEILS
ncbi:RHS repeat-associated core domain-containing protein [Eubacteriales bacterium OttesenSCG-928-M02]|nr:RHS repeat-associated core domain-containing protein [Eubacteriales bacterium OttesenSCG-928-M02]